MSGRHWLGLWIVEPDKVQTPTDALAACMDADERRRALAIRSESRRRLFVTAHVALRQILASHLGVEPQAVVYRQSEPAGKPQLHPDLGSSLRFNLSHTRGLAIVAVALEREVGVDVEWIGRRIARLPDGRRKRDFLLDWTRREAVAKLTGEGLAGLLARRGERSGGDESGFTLLDLAPTREHVGAVAFADAPAPGCAGVAR